jgi:hypothetical protein
MNRTTCLGAATIAALLALAAPAAAFTTDAPLAGTTFQAGDGDQEATGGLRDWATVAPSPGTTSVDPPSSGRNMFSEGSKEQAPGAWTLVGREPSNKFNFLAAWARAETGSREDLYLAFRRESPNGNTYLTFELNQDTRRWDSDGNAATPDVPCRQDGDVLLSYEIEPGGTAEPDPVTVRLYRWHEATQDTATGCSRTGTMTGGAVLNSPLGADPLAQGAINEDGPITNHLDTDGDGRPDTPVFGRGTFGEAGINVTGAVEQLGLKCGAFGQIQLHSRASVSIDSAVKDYVAPVPLRIDTCGENPPPPPPPPHSPPPHKPPATTPPVRQPPAVTPPPAGQQVLAVEQQGTPRGRAGLRGPSGCVHRPFTATVSGRQIRRVMFFLDGRRVVIRTAKRGQRTFKARIRPGSLSIGVHRVTARVAFRAASRTRARTLVLSFQHCAQLAPAPRFTG